MVRLRRVPVLVSTLALVAGCGSADRVEVSGVVRDVRTGSPLGGARVTSADGVATHTDAEGRFTLAVTRGLRTQLRVSAQGHTDAVQSFGADAFVIPEMLAFELEPEDLVFDDVADPHAVVRWDTAAWIAERFSRGHAEAQHDGDGGANDARAGWEVGATRGCPARSGMVSGDTPPEVPDEMVAVGGENVPWLGAGAACVSCHREGDAGIQAEVVFGAIGPSAAVHVGLGDSCLSCHDARGAVASNACERCHGAPREGVGGDTQNRAWHIELDVASSLDDRYQRAVSAARAAMRRRMDPSDPGDPPELETAELELGRWVEALERDGSRGAHDPGLLRAVEQALAR